MKKNFLLSFCLLSVCGISACSSFWESNRAETAVIDEDIPSIDATVNPYDRCGVNGISCNDTALVNYTKTEADYRAYGERTKRDHLYTQSAAGNNLTATIRPGIEEDVVTANKPLKKEIRQPVVDDGVFSQTATLNIETTPANDQQVPYKIASNADNTTKLPEPKKSDRNEIGRTDNIELKEIKKSINNDGSTYEIICEEECDEIMDDDVITSEFTEESFDIADYVDDDNIEFTNVGEETTITADINVDDIKITDETILTWEAAEGDNLRELLTKWSAMAGWKLLWNTNRNYILSAGVMFKGKFADVSSALIRAFARARPAPIATYYKGNRVIVIETMENENAY